MTALYGTALVRAPSGRLAEGIVTHIARSPVDVALAREQHAAYAAALAAAGWVIGQVPAAEDCPDSVFVEDTVVVCEDLAVLARPGARRPPGRSRRDCPGWLRRWACARRGSRIPGRSTGVTCCRPGPRCTSGAAGGPTPRASASCARCWPRWAARWSPCRSRNVLHLKSAVTALPDGTFLLLPHLVPAALFPAVRPVEEESGCHVVPLGGDRVLIAASAPRTAELIEDLGLHSRRGGHHRVREARRLRHLPERAAARALRAVVCRRTAVLKCFAYALTASDVR